MEETEMSMGMRKVVPVIAVVALSGLLAAGSAAALPASCSRSGRTVTCTYTSGPNPFTVPGGVFHIHVVAVGGMGGGGLNSSGGHGAVVSGDLPVTFGETLYAVVGANGGSNASSGGTAGGASDLRTSPTDLSSRLLVAAGGGAGGGSDQFGVSAGGNGGAAASNGAPGTFGTSGGGGGAGGTSSSGGGGGQGAACPTLGGQLVSCTDGSSGAPGSLGVGGAGGNGGASVFCFIPNGPSCFRGIELLGGGGGGGGGGLFGGGGGGGGLAAGGGGGGGSNLVPPGGSASVDTTGTPLVKISYTHGEAR